MLCRKCKEKLKTISQGFDTFNFLNPTTQMYCDNNFCEIFGYVVVAGLPEEPTTVVVGENEKSNDKK